LTLRSSWLVILLILWGLAPILTGAEEISPAKQKELSAEIVALVSRVDSLQDDLSEARAEAEKTKDDVRVNELLERLSEVLAQLKSKGYVLDLFSDEMAAGKSTEAIVDISKKTRWQAVKERIRKLFRAYTDKNMMALLALFSDSAGLSLEVFRNAIVSEFQRETDIRVDVELLAYYLSRDVVLVRFRWNRHSVMIETGRNRINSGIAEFWLRRDDHFLVYQLAGAMPFGLDNLDFQKMLGNSRPTYPSYLTSSGELADSTPGGLAPPAAPPPPGPPPPPVPPTVHDLTIQLDFRNGGLGNLAAIDLELGTVRKRISANPAGEVPQPGEDFFLFVPLGFPSTTIQVLGVNGSTIANCGPSSPVLLDLRQLTPSSLVGASNNLPGASFGVQTGEASFAFLRVADAQLASYILGGVNPVIHPEASMTCL
jgi:outer membrane murein-binding lipoprotein Lpp